MLTLASREARDGGKLTRQFCRWTREISAAVDCAFLLGAILTSDASGDSCLCASWNVVGNWSREAVVIHEMKNYLRKQLSNSSRVTKPVDGEYLVRI